MDYPSELIQTRRLLDGSVVTVRPIRTQDAAMEQDFVRRLSQASRYERFMAHLAELSERKLRYFTEIDYDQHMAFVAIIAQGDKEIEIGVSRYAATLQPGNCEFAVAVDDAWQARGVAGLLMVALIDAARRRGFKTMEGIVLRTNHKMLRFARHLGFEIRPNPEEADTVTVVRTL